MLFPTPPATRGYSTHCSQTLPSTHLTLPHPGLPTVDCLTFLPPQPPPSPPPSSPTSPSTPLPLPHPRLPPLDCSTFLPPPTLAPVPLLGSTDTATPANSPHLLPRTAPRRGPRCAFA